MHEALMASCANVVGEAFTEGRQPDVKQQRTTGGSAFYRDLRHGRWPPARAGRPGDEVRQEPAGRARPARAGALVRMAGRRTRSRWSSSSPRPSRQKPLDHWMEWLATLDICYGPVNTLPEAIEDPNLLKRGMIVTGDDGRKHFAPGRALQGRAVTAALSRAAAGRTHGRGPASLVWCFEFGTSSDPLRVAASCEPAVIPSVARDL